MQQIDKVAVLGAGVIGASWSALFLAAGHQVSVYDPAKEAEKNVRDYLRSAWPTMRSLGLTDSAEPNGLEFHRNPVEAVQGADFVQESVPEKLELKHALYAEIEPHLKHDAIVASSASGLLVSEMQRGWQNPYRFLLGHPFNPPHLIPLVELIANAKTGDGVLETAEAFYQDLGKITIRVKREVPGHVANRLQAALWREAIHLVESGVASVEDVDKAVWAGPGLRWAAMGPHMLFHLGAGPGGMEAFCNRYRASMERWWNDLGEVELTPGLSSKLAAGVDAEARGKDVVELGLERDALIVAMLRATASARRSRASSDMIGS